MWPRLQQGRVWTTLLPDVRHAKLSGAHYANKQALANQGKAGLRLANQTPGIYFAMRRCLCFGRREFSYAMVLEVTRRICRSQ